MTESQVLSKVKLRKIYQELNHFFYKKEKINIAVESAIKKKKFKDFKLDIKDILSQQIEPFTKEKNVKKIINKVNKVDQKDWVLAVAILFTAFLDIDEDNENLIRDFLTWSAIIGGIDALAKMSSTTLSFSPTSERSQNILQDRIDFLPIQLDQTTMEWVAMLLENGVKDKMSALEIAQQIEEAMIEMTEGRSEMIAEQELVNMVGQFNYETFLNNGVTEHKWITAGDERTCPICSGNEDQGFIPITKKFSSGVYYPPAHVACRCYTEPNKNVSGIVWRG